MGNNLNIYIAADNIISSLGFTSQQAFDAISAYQSGVRPDESGFISDTPVQVAKICSYTLQSEVDKYNLNNYSKAEQLIILSVNQLLQQYNIDLSTSDSALMISTTKGNINALEGVKDNVPQSAFLWDTAEKISEYYNLNDRISVVSNACISGLSAMIVARRLLQGGVYRNIVVVGVDVLSHFIASGFASFKSLSPDICKPYDAARDGLNLGEACSSILLTTDYCEGAVMLHGGAITNDANHISGPSRTGDGLYYAMQVAMDDAGIISDDVDYVNLHGTATVYNDEMEAKAVHWAGLQHVPINSLKPYFGHTLGASGIVESILCVHQLKAGVIFGTLGYSGNGLTQAINVDNMHRTLPIKTCVKTASGFGGCNAAIILSLKERNNILQHNVKEISSIKHCIIENSEIIVDNQMIFKSDTTDFSVFIREAYKNSGENNMKFYKMDDLSKLGYIAAAYLLKDGLEFNPLEMGIILANSAASLDTDIKHQQIIDAKGDESVSPAVFVYTLPNVMAGEICIRHKIQGENTFFIEREYSPEKLKNYVQLAMQNNGLKYCIFGWCDFLNGEYKAELELVKI